jgi:excinuclease ABC subunit B
MPVTGVFIERDLSINEELECECQQLPVARPKRYFSSCIGFLLVWYWKSCRISENLIPIEKGIISELNYCINWQSLYSRTGFILTCNRMPYASHADEAYRIHFFGDEIEEIESFDIKDSKVLERKLTIYPANMFVTSPDVLQGAIWQIHKI